MATDYAALLAALKKKYEADSSGIKGPSEENLNSARKANTISNLMNNLFQAQAKMGNVQGKVSDTGANFDFYGQNADKANIDKSILAKQAEDKAMGTYKLGVEDIGAQQQAQQSAQSLANAKQQELNAAQALKNSQQQYSMGQNQKALSDINLQRERATFQKSNAADLAAYNDEAQKFKYFTSQGMTTQAQAAQKQMEALTKAAKLEKAAQVAEQSGKVDLANSLRVKASKVRPSMSMEDVQNQRALDAPINAQMASVIQSQNKPAQLSSIDKTDITDAKEVGYRYNAIKDNANKLKEIISREGTVALTGTSAPEMDSKIYQMAVDFAKLVDPTSVAREGEVAAAQKYMLPIRNWGGMQYSNKTALKYIDKYIGDLDQRLKARAQSFGEAGKDTLKRQGVGSSQQQSISNSPSVSANKVRVSNGSEIFEIDESDLSSARKDGYEVVK